MARGYMNLLSAALLLLLTAYCSPAIADPIYEGPEIRLKINTTLDGVNLDNSAIVTIRGYGGPEPEDREIVVNVTNADFPVLNHFNEVRVFIANDIKNILEIRLNQTGQGHLVQYWTPYKIRSEKPLNFNSGFTADLSWTAEAKVTGSIIPDEAQYASAAVVLSTNAGTVYHNYYSIFNFPHALPDLMVVEEFFDAEKPICPSVSPPTTPSS